MPVSHPTRSLRSAAFAKPQYVSEEENRARLAAVRAARQQKKVKFVKKGEDKKAPMTRVCTINLHKRLHGM